MNSGKLYTLRMEVEHEEDPYDILAGAVIKQAVMDYVCAQRKIKRYEYYMRQLWWNSRDPKRIPVGEARMAFNKYQKRFTTESEAKTEADRYKKWKFYIQHDYERCKRTIGECKKFIKGDWFKNLTNLDGPLLLDRVDRFGVKEDIMNYDASG